MARRTKKGRKSTGYIKAKMRAWSKAHGRKSRKNPARPGASAGYMHTLRGGEETRVHRRRMRSDQEYHRKAVDEHLDEKEKLLLAVMAGIPQTSAWRRPDEKKKGTKKTGTRRYARTNRRRTRRYGYLSGDGFLYG